MHNLLQKIVCKCVGHLYDESWLLNAEFIWIWQKRYHIIARHHSFVQWLPVEFLNELTLLVSEDDIFILQSNFFIFSDLCYKFFALLWEVKFLSFLVLHLLKFGLVVCD